MYLIKVNLSPIHKKNLLTLFLSKNIIKNIEKKILDN